MSRSQYECHHSLLDAAGDVEMVAMHLELLKASFEHGVAACRAAKCLPVALPKTPPRGRTIVLGAGKAAGEMALVASKHLQGKVSGLVVTPYGHKPNELPAEIKILEGGHPIPDESSYGAALEMLDVAHSAGVDDRVIFLISGGGSALLSCPSDGVSLEEKQELNDTLIKSGASITEINAVRAHLSKVKGGRLAVAALPAELQTFIISDVVGDDPATVASGPSIARKFNPDLVRDNLSKYSITLRPSVDHALSQSFPSISIEHSVSIIARAEDAINSIDAYLGERGWRVVNLGASVTGDATDVARQHAELALKYCNENGKFALISGGELTVKVVNPNGGGGPNLEYLTSMMLCLNGADGIEALACDSDGIDGSEDNAGGYIHPYSLRAAIERGLDPAALLARNQSYCLFEGLQDLIKTGPTRTNVNDIRIILVDGIDSK